MRNETLCQGLLHVNAGQGQWIRRSAAVAYKPAHPTYTMLRPYGARLHPLRQFINCVLGSDPSLVFCHLLLICAGPLRDAQS